MSKLVLASNFNPMPPPKLVYQMFGLFSGYDHAHFVNLENLMQRLLRSEVNLKENTQNKKKNTSSTVLGGHASVDLMAPHWL